MEPNLYTAVSLMAHKVDPAALAFILAVEQIQLPPDTTITSPQELAQKLTSAAFHIDLGGNYCRAAKIDERTGGNLRVKEYRVYANIITGECTVQRMANELFVDQSFTLADARRAIKKIRVIADTLEQAILRRAVCYLVAQKQPLAA